MAEKQGEQPETQDADIMSVRFTLLGEHSVGLYIQDTMVLMSKFTTAEEYTARLTGVLADTITVMAAKLAALRGLPAEAVLSMAENGEEGGAGFESFNGKPLDC
jgi:hypothetical protein